MIMLPHCVLPLTPFSASAANHDQGSPVRTRLRAGGRWIRTPGSTQESLDFEPIFRQRDRGPRVCRLAGGGKRVSFSRPAAKESSSIYLSCGEIRSTSVISGVVRIPTASYWRVIGRGRIVNRGRWIVDRSSWVVVPVRIRTIVGICSCPKRSPERKRAKANADRCAGIEGLG